MYFFALKNRENILLDLTKKIVIFYVKKNYEENR